MCFDPKVDVVVGVATSVIAASTLKRTKNPQVLPLATIPAVFAIHLFSSAIVWLGLQGEVPRGSLEVAKFSYLCIAFVFWPTYIPLALFLIEPESRRRIALSALIAVGIWVSISYLQAILNGHGVAMLERLYVDFHVNNVSAVIGGLYFVTTCGSALISSNQRIFIWGIANLVIVLFLVAGRNHGLPSLWCFWAATTSIWIWCIVSEAPHQDGLDATGHPI